MTRVLVLSGTCSIVEGRPGDFLTIHSEVVSLETRFGYQQLAPEVSLQVFTAGAFSVGVFVGGQGQIVLSAL